MYYMISQSPTHPVLIPRFHFFTIQLKSCPQLTCKRQRDGLVKLMKSVNGYICVDTV